MKKRIEVLRELLKTTTDEALRVQIKKEINQLTGWIETSDQIQVIQCKYYLLTILLLTRLTNQPLLFRLTKNRNLSDS